MSSIPLDLSFDISRFLTRKQQGKIFLSSPQLLRCWPEAIAHQESQAMKIAGIFKEVFEQASKIPHEQKRSWTVEQVDRRLEKGKFLLTKEEWENAKIDPDVKKLAPFEKIKMGEILAEKRAVTLIEFFMALGETLPEVRKFLQEQQTLSKKAQAEAIRKWMHEHPELLDNGQPLRGLPTYPEEIFLLPHIPPVRSSLILAEICAKRDLECMEKLFKDARFREIPPHLLGTALRDTAGDTKRSGYLEVVQALIACSRFHEIEIQDLIIALKKSVSEGPLPVARALIACSRFREIVPFYLEDILMISVWNGHLEIVEDLIASDKFSEIRTDALEEALAHLQRLGCRSGSGDQIEALLTSQLSKRRSSNERA